MEQKYNKIRPPFLSALCILTFIGSVISFFGYFLVSVFFEEVSDMIIKYSSWHSTEVISPVYFTTLMALAAISLTGAIRMWKLHRDGYFLYMFSQIIILFLPTIWIGWQAFSVTNAIITGIFIIGYGINLKYLR
jgi:hypothetical protein